MQTWRHFDQSTPNSSIAIEPMETAAFDSMIANDQQHWWYVGRRRILREVIRQHIQPPADAKILEVGCGTGHNLPMLQEFGDVAATEINPSANRLASQRLGRTIAPAALPALEGVQRDAYDLIASLDVLEHVEEDAASLESMLACLRTSGSLLLTVPAYQFMWSDHDVKLHHYRRYSKSALIDICRRASAEIRLLTHFNTALFPVALGHRLIGKLTRSPSNDDALPAQPVNLALQTIFAAERHLVGRIPMPFGLSLLAVLQRR